MISPAYCVLMARYNAWQNASLMEAAEGIGEVERRRERGAFFGSIFGTFLHLYRDDALWLARFAGDERPEAAPDPVPEGWAAFREARMARDRMIVDWATALSPDGLDGMLAWYPGGGEQRMQRPRTLCAAHLFNHQTHHRGQVHAMLTSIGAVPEPTDLPMLG